AEALLLGVDRFPGRSGCCSRPSQRHDRLARQSAHGASIHARALRAFANRTWACTCSVAQRNNHGQRCTAVAQSTAATARHRSPVATLGPIRVMPMLVDVAAA
ncbi:hypothetical protein, partial [Xanthomonas phaseoli]|uniref:hypothetical protein n=1 Tax=Xanthomonas phaseoli TaxID=1985254 RepID=UPI001EE68818